MNQPELEAITCIMLAQSARACAYKSRFVLILLLFLSEKVAYVAWRFRRAGRTSGEIRAQSAREGEAKPREK